jgi:hypothetical protein
VTPGHAPPDSKSPRGDGEFRPRLGSSKLAGQPIEVPFPAPLVQSQQNEIRSKPLPLLSNMERRISFNDDKVVVEGLLVRESKPVRDAPIASRDSIDPRPIRLRQSTDRLSLRRPQLSPTPH